MSIDDFRRQVAELVDQLAGMPLDGKLQQWLNREHGAGSAGYGRLAKSCRRGVEEGWLCEREAGGIRYGRVFKPAEDLGGFSVDVVDMNDIAGPHHSHPHGEIDLVIPLDDAARFDGHSAGWVVYGPGSAHRPTVSEGRALVMYLLPGGSIEFTR